jgi:hypothetical protein
MSRGSPPFRSGDKTTLLKSPALRAIDYTSSTPVILAINTSYIAVGFQLCQCNVTIPSRCYYNQFCSITLNNRESKYSQPKLEIYGLYHVLHALRLYLIGVQNLVVEVDARYIKGMLSNPDISPSTNINRWIVTISPSTLTSFTYLVPTMDPMDSQDDRSKMEIMKIEMMKKTSQTGLISSTDSFIRLISLTFAPRQPLIPFPFLSSTLAQAIDLSEEDNTADTTQAPYPHVDRCRLALSDTYWSSYAEDNNFPHIER